MDQELIKKERLDKYLAYGFIAIYIVVNILYGLNETATWDDDCPTRYYNTLDAFNNPRNFISTWNRPLFVLVFCMPVHLGKSAILIGMVFITAIAGLYLWKGLKKLNVPNAYLVLPLFFFQTFFFSVSRNAETEPLSAALICFGFYFLTQKKWLHFAIAGSLIPLARLELSVLLIFWVFELIKNKQFKFILILGIPVLLWNIAGGIADGNFLFLFDQTIGADNSENRYGHTTFGHYFQRYIYAIGPVIYSLFVIGFAARIKKISFDGFVLMQFLTGFMVYVIFSWKLNMGNAAGFLRNLLPLTPLAAILALEGYNYILNAFALRRTIPLNEPQEPKIFPDSQNPPIKAHHSPDNKSQKKPKQHSVTHKKTSFKETFLKKYRLIDDLKNNRISIIFIFSLFVILAVLAYFFHSYVLEIHHKISKERNYLNLYVTLLVIGFFTILYFILRKRPLGNLIPAVAGVALSLGMLAFTCLTEKPDNNNNPEREAMKEVSDLYVNSYLQDLPIYVNHIWFFWVNDLDRLDPKYMKVTKANLNSAKTGSICIWENHYSHRLEGDVNTSFFNGSRAWAELTRKISSDNKFNCIIYQKIDSLNLISGLNIYDQFFKQFPGDNYAYVARGNYKMNFLSDPAGALEDYQISLANDSNQYLAYFSRGITYLKLNKWDLSIIDFRKSAKIKPNLPEAFQNIGMAQSKLFLYDSAIMNYSRAIALKADFTQAYQNRAFAYQNMNNYEKALEDYSKVLNLDKKNVSVFLNRSQIYLKQKKWALCLADVTELLKQQSNNGNAWNMKGICERNLGKNEDACKSWNKANNLGIKQAGQYLMQFCK